MPRLQLIETSRGYPSALSVLDIYQPSKLILCGSSALDRNQGHLGKLSELNYPLAQAQCPNREVYGALHMLRIPPRSQEGQPGAGPQEHVRRYQGGR